MTTSTTPEIIEDFGIIIGADSEMDLLIVWPEGGTMLQAWSGDMSGNYENTDVKSFDYDRLDLKKAMEKAEEWLDDIRGENEDEEE